MKPQLEPSDPRLSPKRRPFRAFLRRLRKPPPHPRSDTDFFTATRHITGAIGAGTTPTFDALEKGADSLNRSLVEQPLPPSTHISHRDSVRHNVAVPISERCLEDFRED